MSDKRIPLNDAAAARRRLDPSTLAHPEATLDDTLPTDLPPRRRRERKPFGTKEQRLAYADRAGYHRHWFNDEPGRLARALEAGYEHVKNDHGQTVSTVVGTARGGGALHAYLMEIPEEWYREDMDGQTEAVRALMAQIEQGDYTRPAGADGQARYAGSTRGNISIREGNRR